MTYAVLGVTGRTGSVVAETLLSKGAHLRVIVRSSSRGEGWKRRGAEVAVADLGDADALMRAFEAVDGAYVLLPELNSNSVLDDQRRNTDSLVRAAEASHLHHVVLLSSAGAQLDAGTGPILALHDAETRLAKVKSLATTFLRAGYFMENHAASLSAVESGVFETFLVANRPIPHVATQDIGTVAANLLLEGGRGQQIVNLSGPREYSAEDVAAALGELVGKSIRVEQAPETAIIPALTALGFTPDLAELYREMTHWINTAQTVWEEDDHRMLRGTTPIGTVLTNLLSSQG